jgi:hypothetical protein
LDGYVCTGINKESEDYQKALKMLSNIKIPNSILVDNVLNPGYVRMEIPQKESIDSMKRIFHPNVTIPLSETDKTTLKEIFSMYNNDSNLIQNVKQRFVEEWNKRESLRKLNEWWNDIPNSITITEVGKVLAHANAQRCDNSLPPLN